MAVPLVQHAEFVTGSLRLRVTPGAERAFTLPTTSPDLARAYLQAVQRARPGAAQVDVTVVLDGTTAIFHGPPTCWDVGVAQRVQRGELRLGILRIRRAGSRSVPAPPAPVGAQADAARARPEERAVGELAEGMTRPRAGSKAVGSLAKILSRPLKVGLSSDWGGCAHMEDASVHHQPLGGDFAFCGVFDGHGGAHAAQFCKDHLHFNVMAASSFYSGDTRAALRDGFRKTEADLMYEQSNSRRGSRGGDEANPSAGCCGSTALLMLLCGESMHLAWLGDCRAVLCRAGAAVALTEDHCLKDSAERARAVADGGRVEGNRLGGYLEVARALGDFDHMLGCKPPGLSAHPSLRTEVIGPMDEFVILGSDGLWGAVQNDDAVRLARAELQAYDGDAGMASEKLVEIALKRHADDNVTAMVVCLNFAASVESERPRGRPRLMLSKRSVSGERPSGDSCVSGGARESSGSLASLERPSLERSSVTSVMSVMTAASDSDTLG